MRALLKSSAALLRLLLFDVEISQWWCRWTASNQRSLSCPGSTSIFLVVPRLLRLLLAPGRLLRHAHGRGHLPSPLLGRLPPSPRDLAVRLAPLFVLMFRTVCFSLFTVCRLIFKFWPLAALFFFFCTPIFCSVLRYSVSSLALSAFAGGGQCSVLILFNIEVA